ncbi:hypothetical protein M427DRAFT_129990 [Gonapodya prolifera JEL478]|uniref:Uncharacterized protein n=1 Tax=Gonapodya prolifera (strain JEL478) TaxID=1344416 RepID=A0A139AZV1_GONPJ|nr:hypothetical protein M427DRAFT_129990 [Gonapodya prolifera JEL478]|eukprot:KXS22272.1 hypothetical protein M427DRAFT_129990 [Gonapodya prolifera JEL478]
MTTMEHPDDDVFSVEGTNGVPSTSEQHGNVASDVPLADAIFVTGRRLQTRQATPDPLADHESAEHVHHLLVNLPSHIPRGFPRSRIHVPNLHARIPLDGSFKTPGNLPVELLRMVVLHLSIDGRIQTQWALAALCLTSRVLNRVTTPYLYSRPRFTSTLSWAQFITTISRSRTFTPNLGLYVRRLDLIYRNPDSEGGDQDKVRSPDGSAMLTELRRARQQERQSALSQFLSSAQSTQSSSSTATPGGTGKLDPPDSDSDLAFFNHFVMGDDLDDMPGTESLDPLQTTAVNYLDNEINDSSSTGEDDSDVDVDGDEEFVPMEVSSPAPATETSITSTPIGTKGSAYAGSLTIGAFFAPQRSPSGTPASCISPTSAWGSASSGGFNVTTFFAPPRPPSGITASSMASLSSTTGGSASAGGLNIGTFFPPPRPPDPPSNITALSLHSEDGPPIQGTGSNSPPSGAPNAGGRELQSWGAPRHISPPLDSSEEPPRELGNGRPFVSEPPTSSTLVDPMDASDDFAMELSRPSYSDLGFSAQWSLTIDATMVNEALDAAMRVVEGAGRRAGDESSTPENNSAPSSADDIPSSAQSQASQTGPPTTGLTPSFNRLWSKPPTQIDTDNPLEEDSEPDSPMASGSDGGATSFQILPVTRSQSRSGSNPSRYSTLRRSGASSSSAPYSILGSGRLGLSGSRGASRTAFLGRLLDTSRAPTSSVGGVAGGTGASSSMGLGSGSASSSSGIGNSRPTPTITTITTTSTTHTTSQRTGSSLSSSSQSKPPEPRRLMVTAYSLVVVAVFCRNLRVLNVRGIVVGNDVFYPALNQPLSIQTSPPASYLASVPLTTPTAISYLATLPDLEVVDLSRGAWVTDGIARRFIVGTTENVVDVAGVQPTPAKGGLGYGFPRLRQVSLEGCENVVEAARKVWTEKVDVVENQDDDDSSSSDDSDTEGVSQTSEPILGEEYIQARARLGGRFEVKPEDQDHTSLSQPTSTSSTDTLTEDDQLTPSEAERLAEKRAGKRKATEDPTCDGSYRNSSTEPSRRRPPPHSQLLGSTTPNPPPIPMPKSDLKLQLEKRSTSGMADEADKVLK